MSKRSVIIGVIVLCLVISTVLIISFLPQQQEPQQPNRGPEISLTNPEPSSTVSGIVPINVEIIDEENLTADIFIDGALITSSNSFNWNTNSYPDGKHSIRVLF